MFSTAHEQLISLALVEKGYLFSQDVQEQPFHFGEQQTF
jgi:hypothetical protein